MKIDAAKPLSRTRAAAQIEALIRRKSLWGQRLPSERDIATGFCLSRGTIQQALAILERQGLVRRRHGSGTYAAAHPATKAAPRAARDMRLAILIHRSNWPSSGWTYFGDMIKGLQHGAKRRGASAELLAVEDLWPADRPQGDLQPLREYHGQIAVSLRMPSRVVQLLKLRHGPTVLLDWACRDVPAIGVVDGCFEGAYGAVRYLIGLGHRRIAFLSPEESIAVFHEKSHGYEAALGDAHLPVNPELIAYPVFSDLADSVEQAVKRFLALPDPPTAIFAATDDRALAAASTLERCGRRVGRDFALAGYGDSAIRLGHADWLTSVRIYTSRMGEAAAAAALDSQASAEGRTIIVPDRLIVRDSTCPGPFARTAGMKM
jgi:DNA-binding LacI/PurR family transcriptional regulator